MFQIPLAQFSDAQSPDHRTSRSKKFVRLLGFAALCLVSYGQLVEAQEPSKSPAQVEATRAEVSPEQAAAEKVMAMLMATDPYCPMRETEGKLEVFGTPTMGALVNQWGEGFKRFHPSTELVISEMKGPSALSTLAKNPKGVVMIARPLTEDELETLKRSGLKSPMQVEVGLQALGVFVHASNPLTTIDQDQFLKIFAQGEQQENSERATETTAASPGQMTWGQLGLTGEWSSKPIQLIYRESTSGTHTFLKNQLLSQRKLREPKETYNSSMEVLQAIAADASAIGISNLRSTVSEARALTLQDGKTSIPCNDLAILSGEYPLVRRITLVFDAAGGEENSLACEFVKYAIGQDGQRETILSGFFPLDPPLLRAQLHKIDSVE